MSVPSLPRPAVSLTALSQDALLNKGNTVGQINIGVVKLNTPNNVSSMNVSTLSANLFEVTQSAVMVGDTTVPFLSGGAFAPLPGGHSSFITNYNSVTASTMSTTSLNVGLINGGVYPPVTPVTALNGTINSLNISTTLGFPSTALIAWDNSATIDIRDADILGSIHSINVITGGGVNLDGGAKAVTATPLFAAPVVSTTSLLAGSITTPGALVAGSLRAITSVTAPSTNTGHLVINGSLGIDALVVTTGNTNLQYVNALGANFGGLGATIITATSTTSATLNVGTIIASGPLTVDDNVTVQGAHTLTTPALVASTINSYSATAPVVSSLQVAHVANISTLNANSVSTSALSASALTTSSMTATNLSAGAVSAGSVSTTSLVSGVPISANAMQITILNATNLNAPNISTFAMGIGDITSVRNVVANAVSSISTSAYTTYANKAYATQGYMSSLSTSGVRLGFNSYAAVAVDGGFHVGSQANDLFLETPNSVMRLNSGVGMELTSVAGDGINLKAPSASISTSLNALIINGINFSTMVACLQGLSSFGAP